MKLLTTLFVSLAATAGANIVEKRVCGDNCARAVTGTAAGTAHVASAKQDCSDFLITTITPPATATETVYTTITETPGIVLRDVNQATSSTVLPAYAKRDTGTPTLPAYATACSGSAAYSSACSCFGIYAGTVTAGYVDTVTLTVTTYASSSPTDVSSCIAVTVTVTVTTSIGSSSPTGPTGTTGTSSPPVTSSTSVSTSVASSSGVATSTSIYNPPIPSSYANCMIDPNNATQLIELIDSNTGISFINVDGIAVEAVDQVINLTQYHFASTKDGPAGVYDLVAGDGEFVAVFDDGHVGFTPSSSDGQTYVASPNGNYVTSIWSVDCNGNILAGILGGSPFQFGLGGDGGNELFAEASNSLSKRQLPSWIEIAVFIADLLHLRTDLGIDDPRCEDPSLTAVVQFGARPPESNGCGTPPFIFNSVPFLSCCNDHDLCYDNCDETYLDCNSIFADCMTNAVNAAYNGTDIGSQVKNLGYSRLAALFAWIVESEIGRAVFDEANSERCTCCPDGQMSCADGCTDELTDPNNCGACGNVCDSGICDNGACSNPVCDGSVCGSFQPGCNGSDDCYCYTTAEGTGFCSTSQFCSDLTTCGDTADCAAGSVCVVGSCCGENVCILIECGTPGQRARALLERGFWANRTTVFSGEWVN